MPPSIHVNEITDGVQDAIGKGSGTTKPRLLLCASPIVGHTVPMLRLNEELAARGYDISFLAAEEFRSQIEKSGSRLLPIPAQWTPEFVALRDTVPGGLPRLLFDMEHAFLGQIPPRWEKLKETLEFLYEEDPARDIVIITEPVFMGALPLVLGAPLPKGFKTRPKVIGYSQFPYMGKSVVTAPFGPGLPPDSSDAGRQRNALMHEEFSRGPFAAPIALQKKLLEQVGAREHDPEESLIDTWICHYDATFQVCPPSLEYDRPDISPKIKFAGCLSPKPLKKDFAFPSFWEEVTRGDRPVVLVTQGTVAVDYSELLIPTIEALADREDLLVVAILGVKGASLPESLNIPANTRVIDYLSYDAVLPHAAVFVMNAGYGGVIHSACHGVPMVLAGETEDKLEVAMRAEWAGVAVNLRTAKPTKEAVREAVIRVMAEPSFKKKVLAMKAENDALDTLAIVEKQIMDLAQ
ncbi:hypothetical protein S40288_00986 [Stachybotrys chartarum IBT 40288]|nr:hypothetical protein S40288_00986 [Stachybotrys chartarum IBT 40288]